MNDFEVRLGDLLSERADQIRVTQIPEVEATVNVGKGRLVLLSTAAVLVVLVAAMLAFDRSNRSTSVVDLASSPATEIALGSQAALDDSDLVVWLAPDADQQAVQDVEVLVGRSGLVAQFTFVSRAATYAEFTEYWEDNPEVLQAVNEDDLPTSFRIRLVGEVSADELAAFRAEASLMEGVLRVDWAEDLERLRQDPRHQRFRIALPFGVIGLAVALFGCVILVIRWKRFSG